jgi:hypothetical protein
MPEGEGSLSGSGDQVRRAVRECLLLLVLPVCVFAGEVWKDKAYSEWNEKEVQKILTSSPWSRELLIAWYPSHGSGPETAVRVPIIGKPSSDPTRDPMNTDTEAGWRPKSTYTVRWASSRTIRRAVFRQSVLRSGSSRATNSAQLDQVMEEYEITISSFSNLTDWPEVSASEWQADAYLRAKTSGRQVVPSHVEIRRGIQANDGPTVEFRFPKALPNGEPLIGKGETGAEFFAQVGPRIYLVTFNPKLMVAKDGLDL